MTLTELLQSAQGMTAAGSPAAGPAMPPAMPLEIPPEMIPGMIALTLIVAVAVLVTMLVSLRRSRSALESALRGREEETARALEEARAAELERASLLARLDAIERAHGEAERRLREEIGQTRRQATDDARLGREELAAALARVGDSLQERLAQMATANEQRLATLSQTSGEKLEQLRGVVDDRLGQIRRDSGEQLERMRATVDEKLQGTLEKRLGESFKQVSERLEKVHQGLGEMQSLAGGVGDLKRVLSNVKLRGGWGEVQLAAMLEEMLTPDQYARNVRPRPDRGEVVEFAVKLPGRDGDPDGVIWLPIDAKFPLEDYQRLVDASAQGEREALEAAARELERKIFACGKDISDKYLHPPYTTDFAVMFLPTEGLYAEVVRRPGLVDRLQRERRVVVAGPSTFAALLNSLQMGFRTLAIQERSSEVWKLLGAVKTEFGKFGDTLEGVNRKLAQASKNMEEAARRSRVIERKLRDVEEIPSGGSLDLLESDVVDDEEGGSEGEAGSRARIAAV